MVDRSRSRPGEESVQEATRLVEFVVLDGASQAIASLLEELDVERVWTLEGDGGIVVHVLVDVRRSEALIEAVNERFGRLEGFGLAILPVEAAVPAPADEEGADQGSHEVDESRVALEELYEDVRDAARLDPVFAVMVAVSTVVVLLGLTRDDVAVVIGAMLIAPLLGPTIALTLGAALGDTGLARGAMRSLGAGIAIAASLSFLWGATFGADPSVPQIASRLSPELGHVALAFAAGIAGALSFTSGVPTVVVGVMVAVALSPPLAVAGSLAGAGSWGPATDAARIFLTNVTGIDLAAVGTFLAQDVRPRVWWEAERARRAVRFAVAIWTLLLVVLGVLVWLSGV